MKSEDIDSPSTLKIYSTIAIDDRLIGHANWAHICSELSDRSNPTNTILVDFDQLEMAEPIVIKKDTLISLEYVVEKHTLETLDLYTTGKLHLNSSQQFIVFQCATEFDYASLCLVRAWCRGTGNIAWQELPLPALRGSWLSACSHWANILPAIPSDDVIKARIDGRKVIHREDFYCAIGEATLGFRGYMGKDLDSFEECLRNLIYGRNKTIELEIDHLAILRQRLRTFSTEVDHFQVFMDILNQCNVKLSTGQG